jgi:alpha-glucan,water dikinase
MSQSNTQQSQRRSPERRKPSCSVETRQTEQTIELEFAVSSDQPVVLHWGLSRRAGRGWQRPPAELWPAGTCDFDDVAVRTPVPLDEAGQGRLRIQIPSELGFGALCYALYFPASDYWDNNRGRDYCVVLPATRATPRVPAELARKWAGPASGFEAVYELGEAQLAVASRQRDDRVQVCFVTNLAGPLRLHWGLAFGSRAEWTHPPAEMLPAGTTSYDERAVQSPFEIREGLQRLTLNLDTSRPPRPVGLNAVLFRPGPDQWLKDGDRDIHVPLFAPAAACCSLTPPELQQLVEQIVAVETGSGSWTLMHRFERCADLLRDSRGDPEALALLFVWLRYAALRQLDWQRRYNTQPRSLTHAQDRLTRQVAELYRRHPSSRPWARLLLTTVGRGGHGQRIRDDILQIMHRHKIKEDSAYFMEQWHQKLHNNATPDDIAICEACLALLRAGGKLDVFYATLQQRGITRERLRSYDRPITTDPAFPLDRSPGLIADLEGYLKLLKSIHSSVDLDTAIEVARHAVSAELVGLLDGLLAAGAGARQPAGAARVSSKPKRARAPRSKSAHRREPAGSDAGPDPAGMQAGTAPVAAPPDEILERVSRARQLLAQQTQGRQDDGELRDLLYLDLALAEHARTVVEGLGPSELSPAALIGMIRSVVQDLALGGESAELSACARHWRRLCAAPRLRERDWALHAKSVVDRMARAVAAESQRWVQVLQPKAELLGAALGVDAWAIARFAEAIVRAMPLFVLSNLLRRLDPTLRQPAELGAWQLISSAGASGRVRVVDRLLAVQHQGCPRPTVVIADTVGGEEDIAPGVTAVITSDLPDLLSHVAVRARNRRVLFATCYDKGIYDELKRLEGQQLVLQVTSAGDVAYEAGGELSQATREEAVSPLLLRRPTFSTYAVAASEFDRSIVGGKSSVLAELRVKLPGWLRIPSSMALPFGVFEQVVQDHANRDVRLRYERLLESHASHPAETLQQLRGTVLDLQAPPALIDAVGRVAAGAGLPVLEQWEASWQSIKRVWASKWTDRAYHSRVAYHISHHDLYMAVLIQQVVAAQYAFVIHTVNPFNTDPEEIYAEVVLGLGETLVGNFPGRALGFVCRKGSGRPVLMSYPSKSIALQATGLIFRSDSNGEDLEGYAGAGLYETVTASPPRQAVVDYSQEPLVWDADLRERVLMTIGELAQAVEQAQAAPQDIEGAVCNGEYYVLQARPQVGL